MPKTGQLVLKFATQTEVAARCLSTTRLSLSSTAPKSVQSKKTPIPPKKSTLCSRVPTKQAGNQRPRHLRTSMKSTKTGFWER